MRPTDYERLRNLVLAVYRHCERAEGFDVSEAQWGIPFQLVGTVFPECVPPKTPSPTEQPNE
jgi:hypothetical protein